MNTVRLLTLFFIIVFFSNSTLAGDSRSRAAALAQNYVNLLGCEHSTITNKTNLHVTNGDSAYGLNSYYLIGINADIDCSGGSGSYQANLIVVTGDIGSRAERDPTFVPREDDLRVRPDVSSPTVDLINPPRAIKELIQKDGVVYAVDIRNGPKDANCCPTLITTDRIDMEKDQTVRDRFGFYHSIIAWRFTTVALPQPH